MVSMPRHQIEEQHHAMPGVTMREYLAHHARRNRRDLPPSDEIEGPVHAELYRGLWIVRCPADPCAGACVASSLDPVYFCPDCGAGWFDVIFPVNKTAIARQLEMWRVVGKAASGN